MNAWFLEILVMMIFYFIYLFIFIFWKWMSHGRMPLVWNMNSWVLKNTWFDQFLKTMVQWWFLKTSELDTSECPNLTQKKYFWVSTDLKKKCPRMQNCMSVQWRGCMPLGTWRVPFGTFGVPFSTFKVSTSTFRVSNCIGPCHDAHAMVGWLTIF